MIDREIQLALVAEAAQSPSVHNVQPARWRFAGDTLLLFEDVRRRLPAGDPSGRDTGVSLGAASEGMAIALSARGWNLTEIMPDAGIAVPDHLRVARAFRLVAGAKIDLLHAQLGKRYSHRGAFAKATVADHKAAEDLANDDLAVITDDHRLPIIGRVYDAASLRFFRDDAFRAELLSWMRLSPRHPQWAIDGLNADAMAMSRIEAVGAGMVLGPRAFPVFDRLGLAGPLTGEAARVTASAGVLVLHRADDEDPFATGRAFYRHWLGVVAAGFQGAVMAALADDAQAQATLAALAQVPKGRRIVTTLRIGRMTGEPPKRARLEVDDLLV